MMKTVKKTATIKTDYGNFVCNLEREKDVNTWGVYCKSVPGVFTVGSTINEAKKMAKEALELQIESKAEERLLERGRIKIVEKGGTFANIKS